MTCVGTVTFVMETRAPTVGHLLRDWRTRRRMSQLDLANEAGISARHLSFVETGRSQPSRGMVLLLADELDVPLRERTAFLEAAGYPAVFTEVGLDAPEMTKVRKVLDYILHGSEPNPTFVLDRCQDVAACNQGIERSLGAFSARFPPGTAPVRTTFAWCSTPTACGVSSSISRTSRARC